LGKVYERGANISSCDDDDDEPREPPPPLPQLTQSSHHNSHIRSPYPIYHHFHINGLSASLSIYCRYYNKAHRIIKLLKKNKAIETLLIRIKSVC